jgi:hypothetical protein
MRVGVFLVPSPQDGGINLQSIANYAANLPKVEKVRILECKPRLIPEALRISGIGCRFAWLPLQDLLRPASDKKPLC